MTELQDQSPCPQCGSMISAYATKCPHCTSDIRYCDRCQQRVGVIITNKWVGALRGGSKPVARCMHCRTIVEGPRW